MGIPNVTTQVTRVESSILSHNSATLVFNTRPTPGYDTLAPYPILEAHVPGWSLVLEFLTIVSAFMICHA